MDLPIKVQGIVYKQNGDEISFLVMKRSKQDGAFWQPITGSLEDGESLKTCLLRELFEEAGIKDVIAITDIIHEFEWKKQGKTITEYVFGVEVNNDVKITLSEEHDDYKWVNINGINTVFTIDSYIISFNKLFSLLQNE